jgi:hypothetical protein
MRGELSSLLIIKNTISSITKVIISLDNRFYSFIGFIFKGVRECFLFWTADFFNRFLTF